MHPPHEAADHPLDRETAVGVGRPAPEESAEHETDEEVESTR